MSYCKTLNFCINSGVPEGDRIRHGQLLNRVREIGLSLARYFVQRTSSPSPNILNSRRTFHCKISREYQTYCWISIRQILSLKCSRGTKTPSSNIFKICRTCPASPADFAYSALKKMTITSLRRVRF